MSPHCAVVSVYRRIIRASQRLSSRSADSQSADVDPRELDRLAARIRFNLRTISAARRHETEATAVAAFIADGHNAAALIEGVAAMKTQQLNALFRHRTRLPVWLPVPVPVPVPLRPSFVLT